MLQALEAVGAIVIGRNEGERLKCCLRSLSTVNSVIYVDSGSTDGSARWAKENGGAEVVALDLSLPFTAARARNRGFERLQEIAPQLEYVQFIDGDCELVGSWAPEAVAFLESHPNVGAVCGRRRERHPEKSIYNWLCDQEWEGTPGEVRACGGDVMVRTAAFDSVKGYREDMIAGEEPEMCVRLRRAKWRIWRLDAEMTLHDAAMTRFSQWWKRTFRSGYAFAHGAYLHGKSKERHWVWESRRAWIWGLWLPLVCVAAAAVFWPWGVLSFLIFPLQLLRQVIRNTGSLKQRTTVALFHLIGRFPEALGEIKFMRDRVVGRRSRLIEYK